MTRIRTAIAPIVAAAKQVWHKEPAVIVGGGITVLVEAQHALTDAHVTSWRTAIPVLVALVVRQFVYSPATVAEHTDIAFDAGVNHAIDQLKVPDDPGSIAG